MESSPTMSGLASHCHGRLNYTKKKKMKMCGAMEGR